ncbi:MAG: D-alanyl-D-alanine carboxypeptidase/D-alanyl-D-alanine-endopeptidase [Sedimentisphaeraceae bacterium JB056]
MKIRFGFEKKALDAGSNLKIKMDFNIRIKISILLFLSGICFGSLRSKINAVINDSSQSKVVYGVEIVDAKNGSVVYSHKEDEPLIPASNMKIFTSATALKVLGADYKFRTEVYFVDNDIVIKGSGDPLLGDQATLKKNGKTFGWEFRNIIEALKQKQITAVDNIIVDSSVFDDQLVNPSWPANELNRDYSAEVSGINYNGNCVDIVAFPSGGRVAFTKMPDTKYITVNNRASVTSARKNTTWMSRLPESNSMTLYGKCHNRTAPFQVTIHRPAVYFGYILAENLIESGLEFNGSIIERREDIEGDPIKLTEFVSPLSEVMTRCNKDSFNLAAECLAKKISAAKTIGNIGGQWKHAGEVIEQHMQGGRIDTSGFVFDDGCGLSRKNKVTAEMISKLLLDVYQSDDKQFFIDTLAVGGVEGSSPVSRYFKDPVCKAKIFAKSGTISGVKALSGYCYTKNGVYIFSIITNNANWKTRSAINNIVEAVFD